MSELERVAAQVRSCQRCPLARGRTNTVPGEGPADAKIMLIGEAPGFHEDRQGRPFVGASGTLLEELLHNIGLSREQVFITNVVKCRPPGNRDPLPEEQDACRPYLDRQLQLIDPRIVITLGRFSMALYFPGQSISRIHGQVKRAGTVAYIPMFHPAAALRQQRWMEAIRQDFAQLPALLQELTGTEAEPESSSDQGLEQLSLF